MIILLSATVALLFAITAILYYFGLEIISKLREIMYFYEVTPLDNVEEPGINLNLLRPKSKGHKTRKPTDRSREWLSNRGSDSSEVK